MTNDAEHDGVLISRRTDNAVHLTLNRPAVLNALNTELLDALSDELDLVLDDEAVRAVVIHGAGPRAFCAGADLKELAGLDSEAALNLLNRGQNLFRRIELAPKPVVAVVDGFAIGGGFELALACHLLVATERSQFGLPEATLGLIPGYGGTQRLTDALGRHLALRLMLTGARLSAREAAEAGILACPVIAPDSVAAAVDELVEKLCRATPAATRTVLAAASAQVPSSLALGQEAALAAIAIASVNGQAGITAMLAKMADR
ncbi:enoyl-CoA hydratase/isomerase family protein [Mycolicibacterium pulveris]|uniref:Probable enoyl-CoA hydratase EchA17 n=1 Tax=Mycolicibacterium pulveris TaxID=36813 RepID=A0A7I7UNQ9_MYCPV|nr:enoyl-CoA hydratase/isomerase family protein [Mycolicibacterium pulveris]MCV6983221.1 enoyl-CoA hydratase/isomerase family protein [Mycolicibacterium pulveris]BBY83092.1 crotonase [Mycolicibacterium pulveris]